MLTMAVVQKVIEREVLVLLASRRTVDGYNIEQEIE